MAGGPYVQRKEIQIRGKCIQWEKASPPGQNHAHLVVIPGKATSLALTFKQTHGRYATYWNAGHQSSGHAWQGRFYSCPLDQRHWWAALRYAERNPVRAELVEAAEEWRWSSAAVHCGITANAALLELGQWQERWDTSSWLQYLREKDSEKETAVIRQCTHTGGPLGTAEFVQAMETVTQRRLTPLRRGRRKRTEDERQGALAFDRD